MNEKSRQAAITAVYDKLHENKLGAHWLWCVIEKIAAGESEEEAMRDFGYYSRAVEAAQPGSVGLCEQICAAIKAADDKSTDEAGYMLDSNDCIAIIRTHFAAAPTEAKPAQQDAVDAEQVEAAAKELSKCMDYPWEHMPASGRSHMRETAKTVIRAAISAKKGGAA